MANIVFLLFHVLMTQLVDLFFQRFACISVSNLYEEVLRYSNTTESITEPNAKYIL